MADVVEVILALRNVSQFVSGSKEASGAIEQVGTAAETSGKKSQAGWKSVAKWAGGAAIFYGVTRYVKGAVAATGDLAKSTIGLTRQTGLDTQTASEWVSLTRERGISAKQLTTSFTALNKQIVKAGQGSKTSSKLLAQMGVPMDVIAKGDTASALGYVADAMSKMTDPAMRSAYAQTLFGRSGQALLPILMQGRQGVADLLAEQKSYGNYLTDKSIKQSQDVIKQQREMEQALSGVKVQLGQALLPVLVTFGKVLVSIARFLRPITSNATALTIVIGAVTAAVIGLKTAIVVLEHWEAIAKVATALWTAAQWLLNVALDANPIGAVVIAITALVAAVYLAYKHVGAFRNAVQFVWKWIKANWPLLAAILIGPFAILALEAYKHFDTLKKIAVEAFNAIKRVGLAAVHAIEHAFLDLPGKIGGALKSIPGVGAVSGAVGGIAGAFAEGGVASRAGAYLVGERGPEVVRLPSGASVSPVAATGGMSGGFGGRALEIVVPVMVDGKQLTRVVARVTSDQLARR